jgi:hypothetical protein
MVTDGLIERRHKSMTTSIEQLREAIEQTDTDLESLCARLLGTFVTEPIEDDIAIVAIHRLPTA